MAVGVFDELERSYEAKYKLDEEQRFKAQCRASKRLGHWAARRLGLPSPSAEAYAKKMVGIALESAAGLAAVTALIRDDLARAGVAVSPADLDQATEQCLAEAFASLTAEYPAPLGPDHIRVGD